MKYSISNYIVTGVFLLIIAFFTVWTWTKSDLKISIMENRALAQRPDANVKSVITGDYSKRFETYYNDQFPTREKFIELNSKVNKYVLGQNIVRDVYVHKDGYLLSPIAYATESSAKQTANRINTFAKQANDLGASTYLVVMPIKSAIMEDKFPDYYPSYGVRNTELLLKHIDPVAHPMNMMNDVKKHINEKNMYFYTDHHWKAKAAFYAYQSIIPKIAKDIPEIGEPYQYTDFTWKEKGKPFYGSDARKTTKAYVKKYDTITVATPKFKEKTIDVCYNAKCNQGFYSESFLNKKDLYTNRYVTYLGGDHPEVVIHNPNKMAGKKLLIIKDSYANAAIQFFARNFEETRILDLRHFNKMPVKDYVKKHHIDAVIIMHNVNSLYITPSLTNYDHPGTGENQ